MNSISTDDEIGNVLGTVFKNDLSLHCILSPLT